MISDGDRVENFAGNGGNAGNQYFLIMFSKAFFSGLFKVEIVW